MHKNSDSDQSSKERQGHFAPGGAPMDNSYPQVIARAQQLAEEGDRAEAVAAYREATGLAPDRPDAHYELGLLHHRLGRVAEAIACFERAAELAPEDASVWNNLGVLHYGQNEPTQAETAFRRALALDECYGDAWYGLARVLLGQGRDADAADALRHCLRWQPQHTRAQTALTDLGCKAPAPKVSGLRIGFVSLWFERGQAYVTRMLRGVMSRSNETFVFARTGSVYGQPKLEQQGHWAVPNLTTHPDYRIPPQVLAKWIEDKRLEAVVFNEEYDWNLVRGAKATGIKVLTYLDYYKEDWKPHMALYDGVLCSTLRTFYLVRDCCNAHYVGWAVDTELFRPQRESSEFTFFHNAGWLGLNYRKMTPAVILAFDVVSRKLPRVTLLVHAQTELERLPPAVVRIVRENPRITYHIETVPAPGLYHKGRILLFPSKLEGLGLPLLEGMACGLPAIATDAPPMNEFVQHGYNGLLVKVAHTETRADNIAFPETIVDRDDLAQKMLELGQNGPEITRMGANARRYAEEELSPGRLGEQVNRVLSELLAPRTEGALERSPARSGADVRPSRPHRGKLLVRATPAVSVPAQDRTSLRLMGKRYGDCQLVRDGGKLHLARGNTRERFRLHLVSARWANHPWGFGNEVYAALEEMGIDVIDTDFRKDRRLLPHLLRQDAHLTLVLKGEGIPPELIRQIPGITVLWYPDDLLATQHGPRHVAHNGRAFDLVYGFARYDLGEYARYGVAGAKWLPLACDPHLHRKLDLPKVHDLCFVGSIFPNRAALLERLGRRFDLYVTRAFGEEMVRIYNQSRIVLNLGIGKGGVQHRVFEALGCGSLLLTNELPPEERVFEDRVHLVYYNDDNIEELIKHYLVHEEEREAIARQGRDEVIRNHTCVHRIEQILRDVFASAAKRPTLKPYPATVPSTPDVESALRWADRRVKHTGWSTSKRALRLLVANLPEDIQEVAEFGAGYSTLFLARLYELRKKPLTIISFEHQQRFFDHLRGCLSSFPQVMLFRADLKQLSDQEYEALFSSRQPIRDYLSMGRPVPRELYPQTRLHNVFYDTDLSQQIRQPKAEGLGIRRGGTCRETGLVILDGPNGNGRSIVFPLLKDLVQTPFWCLMDDITHHPYMEQLARLFNYETVFLENFGHDAYALVRVQSVK